MKSPLITSVRQRLRELTFEAAVYGLPSILRRFISVLTLPILTRILTPADYGIMGVLASLTTLVGVFLSLGTDSAIAFYYYNTEVQERRRSLVSTWIYFYLSVAALAATILWLIAEWLAVRFLGGRSNADLVRLVAISLFLGASWTVAWNILRIQRKKWWVILLMSGNLVLTTALVLVMVAVFKLGLRGVYIAYLLAWIPFFVMNLWILRPWLPIKCLSLDKLRPLLTYGLPLVPALLSFWVIDLIDRVFVDHYRGLAEVGYLSIGASLASLVALGVGAFVQAWTPFAFSIQKEPEARTVYARTLTLYLAVTSGGALALTLFSPEILRVFTTKDYIAAAVVVPYFAFAAIGNGAYYIASIGVSLAQKTAHIGWTTSVAAAVILILNLILVPRIGMVGAAIASVTAQWLSTGLLFAVAQRRYPIPYQWREVVFILGISALAIAASRLIMGGLVYTLAAKSLLFLVWGGVVLAAVLIGMQYSGRLLSHMRRREEL